MKRLASLILFAALTVSGSAFAAGTAAMDSAIAHLQSEWGRIKYQVPDEDTQSNQMAALADEADRVVAEFPGKAAPLIWSAIIKSTQAGIDGGLGGLSKARKARDLLEQAQAIDPDALEGSISTTLGSLYYQVPGFPIGFGSKKKAREYLEKAIAVNPDGIDPNFFYGDFLLRQGDYKDARTYLSRAMQAPLRSCCEVADRGRKGEIRDMLTKVDQKLDHQS